MEGGRAGLLLAAVVAALVAVAAVAAAAAAARLGGGAYALARTREVRSGADGQAYRVHVAHGDPRRAADALAEVNRRTTELLRHLRRRYVFRQGGGEPARVTRRLLGRYNPDNWAENSPQDPRGETAYTIDKGAVLALCLRTKAPPPRGAPPHGVHDPETLMFVALHELTHVAVDEPGHPLRFWQTYRFLLEAARAAGVLEGVDYGRRPAPYCGVAITYNPLYDPGLPPLR